MTRKKEPNRNAIADVERVAKNYDEQRERILKNIREGNISASMSNIDYFRKPFAHLDLSDGLDRFDLVVWLKDIPSWEEAFQLWKENRR